MIKNQTSRVFNKNIINAKNIIDYIADIFETYGAEIYLGEKVTTVRHMLLAAKEAELAQASPALVVAALLHDIGHFSNEIPESTLMKGTNNFHEEAGANFLAQYFPPTVTEPIRQHVAAKRYLCTTNTEYLTQLSEASVFTLKLQGGRMSADEVAAFEKMPHYKTCIELRLWDDKAKDPDKPHPDFFHYRGLVQSLIIIN